MSNLRKKFDFIIPIVKDALKYYLNEKGNIPKKGKKPTFSDAEVITLSLLSECVMIDSENYLFALIKNEYSLDFPNIIDRTVYNRRRKSLFAYVEIVRQYLSQRLIEGENTFIIDSMPLEICKFSRAKRISICQDESETAPAFGYCAAQDSTYFGYKLHCVISTSGVISSFDLSKANVADIHYLQDIQHRYQNCTLLGDRAYLSNPVQQELFEDSNLLLNTPMRKNQANFHNQPAIFRRVRKRIETMYSQFCDYLAIRKNYAKKFLGLAIRILSKITGFTLMQFLNKFYYDKKLNHVKHTLLV